MALKKFDQVRPLRERGQVVREVADVRVARPGDDREVVVDQRLVGAVEGDVERAGERRVVVRDELAVLRAGDDAAEQDVERAGGALRERAGDVDLAEVDVEDAVVRPG